LIQLLLMLKQKLIIAGIIFLLVVVGLGYLINKPGKGVKTGSSEKRSVFTSQEYGFSVTVPEGWTYKTTPEKAGEATLAIQLKSPDGKIYIPIFVEKKGWDLVLGDVRKNFKPEAIEETTLAGQPAVKIVAKKKEINPGYNFRIKHPKRENTVLLGVAFYIRGKNLETFHSLVETILNSITFN